MADEVLMLNEQMGKRVDKLDGEVHSMGEKVTRLQTDMGGLVSTVDVINDSMGRQSQKLDALLQRGTSTDATRDMVPIKYVTWGIGTFLATVLSGLGLLFTALTIGGALVMFAINGVSASAQSDREILLAKIIEESADRKDDIRRIDESLIIRRDWMEEVSRKVASLEAFREEVGANRWTSEQQKTYGESIDRRLATLEGWRERNLQETVIAN